MVFGGRACQKPGAAKNTLNHMEQRDILKKQIEQIGKLLGKILARFTGLKTAENISEAIQVTNRELQKELGLDIDNLVNLNAPELENQLKTINLTEHHLDQLSHYFFEIGSYHKANGNDADAHHFFSTALKIVDLADKKSSTFTFDRLKLKEQIYAITVNE